MKDYNVGNLEGSVSSQHLESFPLYTFLLFFSYIGSNMLQGFGECVEAERNWKLTVAGVLPAGSF